MKNSMQTKQKIVITGHSSGLGKALAGYYAAHGTTVFGISRRMLEISDGLMLRQHSLDLADTGLLAAWLEQGELAAFIADAEEIVLINNAGVVEPNAVLGRQQTEQIAKAVAVNVTAPLLLSNHLAAHKSLHSHLKIVHISSGAGRKGYPGWSVYGATKAALDHHARCVEAERNNQIKVISLAPGIIDTEMQDKIRSADAGMFPMQPRFQDLKRQGGLSSPEETASQIAEWIDAIDEDIPIIADIRDYI
ncbi:oxidoreductase, short-chain dehydrogenase/reductase family [Neisseria weaveri ATCC 51223]|nr:oxidoreductase, short-chain dehydrogenase/reductase family [Neisseria weaveri ATCC 51223]